jgi:hypothetical protein
MQTWRGVAEKPRRTNVCAVMGCSTTFSGTMSNAKSITGAAAAAAAAGPDA